VARDHGSFDPATLGNFHEVEPRVYLASQLLSSAWWITDDACRIFASTDYMLGRIIYFFKLFMAYYAATV
jgi:hypothetical protein